MLWPPLSSEPLARRRVWPLRTYPFERAISACMPPPHVEPTLSPPPILFGFTADRRCVWVLEFEPVRRPARAITRADALGEDAFAPSWQACWNTVSPQSCSRCAFRRTPSLDLRRMLAASPCASQLARAAGRSRRAPASRSHRGRRLLRCGGDVTRETTPARVHRSRPPHRR